jgi:molybdopterin-guanine dinucleotide biosynthesis protein A
MGQDKSTLPWENSDFLHTILQKLAIVCSDLIVVTNAPPTTDLPAVRFVPDIIPGCGPLSGIHAGLTNSASPFAFVTACDMPFIQPAAVSWLFSQLQDWDAVVPGNATFMEPLFAVYAKTCIPFIEDLLRQDIRKTQALFQRIQCKIIPTAAFLAYDPALRLLQNINAPEDYQAALREMRDPSVL